MDVHTFENQMEHVSSVKRIVKMKMADMKRRCITVEPACLHEKELSECEPDKEIPIKGVLNSYFWFLAIFGIFNPIALSEKQQLSHPTANRILKYVCLFTIFFSSANFFRHLLTYMDVDDFEKGIPKILISLFFVQSLINTFVSNRLSNNKNHMFTFLKNWRKCTLTSYKDRESLRRISNLAVIITCALIGGNIIFFGYVSYRVDFFDNVIAPYTKADSLADFLKGVYLVVKTFLSGSWLGLCGLEILITLLLGKELRIYVEHLQNRIKSKNYDLEDLRQHYTALCDLIEKANDMFKLYNGSTWVTSIAHILLLLYSLIWFPDTRHNTLVFLAHIFWMVAVTVMLLTIAICCTIVSDLAHKPTHILYVLPLRNVSTEFSLQLSGMLATYFVVLLQFKQSLEPATSSNSTLLSTA
ncbi:unnamed protein product [Mytilus edulis]|uniref:Gustatory receptor n=1 Tax=Mytilus edulis TaxID=6550 RepID=A0A8S3SF08_MYTED|nr:unnamed protein product [Mytilus edulis]